MPTVELQELLELAEHVLMQLAQLILDQTEYNDVQIKLIIAHV